MLYVEEKKYKIDDNTDILLMALYLSKFDMSGVLELKYSNRNEAFIRISQIFGINSNTLRMHRDEFDVLTESNRKGWRNREPRREVKDIYSRYGNLDIRQFTEIIINVLHRAELRKIKIREELLSEKVYIEDTNLILESVEKRRHYSKSPKPVGRKVKTDNYTYYRDATIAAVALCNANYCCEIDETHKGFIRKTNGKNYTEPHHLIPISYQDEFKNSLDVENNIVSLCSNCHNKLHYGRDIVNDLKFLYDKRKDLLKLAGIDIAFEKLLEMYTK